MSDEEVQTKAPAKRGRKPKAETAAAKKEKVIFVYPTLYLFCNTTWNKWKTRQKLPRWKMVVMMLMHHQ